MTLINFSNILVLGVWIFLFLVLNIFGFVKKLSWFNLSTLVFSVFFLITHTVYSKEVEGINILVDFISMIISIFLYLYVDEIQSRRQVISEVFENKYKKRKKK